MMIYVTSNKYYVRHVPDNNEWNLVIKNVQPSDAGVYECQVSSRKKLIRHVMLRVNETGRNSGIPFRDNPSAERPTTILTGSDYVNRGETLTLTCNATGPDLAPDVDWFHNGHKLTSQKPIHISKHQNTSRRLLISTLKIKHAKMSDAGVYLCRSSTDLEIASKRVHILNEGLSSNVKRGTSAADSSCGKSFVSRTLILFLACLALSHKNIYQYTDRANQT
ncbi:hypothetical protein ScPMuIL_018907 [Solemya velum]